MIPTSEYISISDFSSKNNVSSEALYRSVLRSGVEADFLGRGRKPSLYKVSKLEDALSCTRATLPTIDVTMPISVSDYATVRGVRAGTVRQCLNRRGIKPVSKDKSNRPLYMASDISLACGGVKETVVFPSESIFVINGKNWFFSFDGSDGHISFSNGKKIVRRLMSCKIVESGKFSVLVDVLKANRIESVVFGDIVLWKGI